ncbi:MAG: DHH family phosphoesterase [Sphaerochaetaceae bacterium]
MFKYPPVPKAIIDAIKEATVAVVIGHVSPDGDCIHSQFAMQKLLQSMGIETHIANAGPFLRKEIKHYKDQFAPHIEKSLYERNPLVVMVDCSTMDRIGYLADEIKGLTVLTVDHHASGTKYSDLAYIVPKSFSTSLCIMQLYKALDLEITNEIADHIFFGLATDTGFLRFIGPYRGETFNLMGELVELGVSPNDIYNRMEGFHSLESRQFLAKLLLESEKYLDGKLIIVVEKQEDVDKYGYDQRPTDSLYAQLLSVEDVEVVLYFKIIEENGWELGFRASHYSNVDVGKLSASLGGGGHKKAAGATVEGPLEELKKKLISLVKKAL